MQQIHTRKAIIVIHSSKIVLENHEFLHIRFVTYTIYILPIAVEKGVIHMPSWGTVLDNLKNHPQFPWMQCDRKYRGTMHTYTGRNIISLITLLCAKTTDSTWTGIDG